MTLVSLSSESLQVGPIGQIYESKAQRAKRT
jgi:hypothetical protein